jgi:phosphatidylserine/phosphatidylglycerophosphate/cardiolipin synthase-like enzyme
MLIKSKNRSFVMKRFKYFRVLLLLLTVSKACGMIRTASSLYENVTEQTYNVSVQVYFAPNDKKVMKNDLFTLLDNATKNIYVAMYWITDDSLIDKLIAAKKRNVVVEIFIDSNSPNLYIEKLLSNGIVPIIFPSAPQVGIMHDKFFIIDSETVFTGSANFTQAAFDENSPNLNRENSLMIRSHDVASAFLKEFVNIQVTVFDLYIDMISQYEPHTQPEWLTRLWPIIFKKEGRLARAFYRRMNIYGNDDNRWARAFKFIEKANTQ